MCVREEGRSERKKTRGKEDVEEKEGTEVEQMKERHQGERKKRATMLESGRRGE